MNLRRTCVFLGLVLCASLTLAQGVTTGALTGVTTDISGAVMPGVNIDARHEPTGTSYTVVSDSQGRFNIQNVKAGGPYSVMASLEGFQPGTASDVYVSLGEAVRLTFAMELSTVTETVTVVGESNPLITPSRTGAASNVSTETIEDLPTIQRSFNDFARTNPFFVVSSDNEDPAAISVAGRNSRYNNIQIDGAVNNDLFGLSDQGTPGGQADTTPISLDAIQELQLVLADFDVRNGGFSGGGINAITRSGTNRHKGSVFYFGRDDSLIGDGPELLGEPGTLDEEQYGFRVGGPLSKDKIFYFVNGEQTSRDAPTGWSLDGATGQCFGNCTAEHRAAAARFQGILGSQYSFDPGAVSELTRPTESDKFFIRFDFNIGDSHQLTLRHNFVDGANLINRPNAFTYEWDSEAYDFSSETNSTVAQFNSVFGSNKFNEARLTFQTIKDRRPGVVDFPFVEVEKIFVGVGSADEYEAGTEPFSTANALDQEVFEINDDFTWITGNHTLTFGTHNEFFTFDNLFIQNAKGSYEFLSMDEFEEGLAWRYNYTIVNEGQSPTQEFDVNQLGFYAGDQWAVKPNLTLNFGLRVDVPFFPDDPSFNPFVLETYGFSTSEMPDGEEMWQPRFGFNWDIGSDGRQQLRGGGGIFAGRSPYVWISNQYARTGIEQTFIQASCRPGCIPFNPDPNNQPVDPPGGSPSFGEFNLIDPSFQFPQVLRVNLAYDRQLPWWDLVGSIEMVWSEMQEDIDYQDLNITPTGQTRGFDGRPLFTKVDPAVTGAYLIKNTSDGGANNYAVKVERPFRRGVSGFVSYAYGDTSVVNDGSSSRAVSNFQFNEQFNPNQATENRSDYSVRHRFNASLAYQFNADSRWPTTLSGFYNLQSGRPYSYIYAFQVSQLNNDNYFNNDVFYVPSGPDDVIITNGTWEQLDRWISSDSCLNDNRGTYVPRNRCKAPWFHTLDIRVAQDIPIRKTHLQLTMDILNVVNIFDEDSGTRRYVNFDAAGDIDFIGETDDGRPIYGLTSSVTDPENNARYETDSRVSRWRMQLGIRWTF